MNKKIFISYRREDSQGVTGRLYDRLENRFGRDRIFMDVDTIQPGMDFVNAIENAINASDVVLVMIGPNWATSVDAEGKRRLENPADFVRVEVATALARNVRVIPVLVSNASMPNPNDLPSDLKSLVRRNAIEISHTSLSDLLEFLASLLFVFLHGFLSLPCALSEFLHFCEELFSRDGWEHLTGVLQVSGEILEQVPRIGLLTACSLKAFVEQGVRCPLHGSRDSLLPHSVPLAST